MGEINRNVWAPWRMEYIESLEERRKKGCFLCAQFQAPDCDARNHVLRRSDSALVVLNLFPYTTGHLLIAPAAHLAELADLPEDVLYELTRWVRDAQSLLTDVLHPQGFNIGLNIGHCAGAGLPNHLHWHIVPRWNGDTNFMPLFGDVRVIPEALDDTYQRLAAGARQRGW